jgi:argininosuccinate lyase
MPQKKNPDTLELVRGRTGDATAGLEGLLTTLKGLPRAYNRDLQRAGSHAYDAIDSVSESVAVAVGAVTTAEWPEEVLAEAAGEGFSTATGVADLLAQAGVPFRTAHEVVARAAEGSDDPDVADLDAASEAVLGESLTGYVDRGAVEAALDPAESVAMRDSRGGPAPDAAAAHLDRARETLTADREAVAAKQAALSNAADQLEEEVNTYV